MNESCYRLLIFRYTMLIAFGCYLAIKRNIYNNHFRLYISFSLAGIVYIILFKYLGYAPVITNYWTGTSFFASLYILPVSDALLNRYPLKCTPLEVIGKASYNIFLVQMVYYVRAGYLYQIISSRILQIIMNIAICLFAGIIFYKIETPVSRFIIQKSEKMLDRFLSSVVKAEEEHRVTYR